MVSPTSATGPTDELARTHLAFHNDAKLLTTDATVLANYPLASLSEANRALFKGVSENDQHYAIVTDTTIFHPQGGGQPSDEGTMTLPGSAVFTVLLARMDAEHDGRVLHFGRFDDPKTGSFAPGHVVRLAVDADKRLLYSRLHTAGHVLGAAVRHEVEHHVAGFDELKASHAPGTAACEFRGSIDGRWMAPIQTRVDDYVRRAMPVRIEWWDEHDFRANGLERLIPERPKTAPREKFRVVTIVGAETYPCGGTHVDSTDLCGRTEVKKISRSKGVSRVSYTVH